MMLKLIQAVPAKIADATLAQTSTAFGILFDKRQLLLGKPTEITADHTFREAIKRVMAESGCDEMTARAALEVYVPAIKQIGDGG